MNMKEQPKRLGRGLAALLGEAAAPQSVTAAGVQNLPVDLLEPSPYQPRKDMDDTALGELADSIAQRGILQPLLVRPHPEKAEHYQIIAGERRWRAAQRASLHEVPVLVRELTNADAMAAGLVENLQREDLNPIEEAQGYERLIKEFSLSQEKLAEAVGKSRGHITNLIRVLKLPAEVLEMVRDGRLTMGHARTLVGQDHALSLARKMVKQEWSVRKAEVYANNLGRSIKESEITRRRPEMSGTERETKAMSDNLSERLGLKAEIKFSGFGGTVTLHYKNFDQLDSLMRLLNG